MSIAMSVSAILATAVASHYLASFIQAVLHQFVGHHPHVHVQYHLARPWLNRFAWFRRRRQLHFVHHREPTKNFAVIDFVWDRLGGTYQPARQGR